MLDFYYFLGHQGFDTGEIAELRALLSVLPPLEKGGWLLVDDGPGDVTLLNADEPATAAAHELAVPHKTYFLLAAAGDPISKRRLLIHAIAQCELALRRVRVKAAVADLIQQRHRSGESTRGLWHVQHASQLIAVVDFANDLVGWSDEFTALRGLTAAWVPRPPSAMPPESFERLAISALMSFYSQRAMQSLLPTRYKAAGCKITLRDVDAQPRPSLSAAERRVAEQLAANPSSLEELSRSTRLGGVELENVLASLYFAGEIATVKPKIKLGEMFKKWLGGNTSPLDPNNTELMQTTAPLSLPPARPVDEQSRAREILAAKFAQGHAFAQAEANLQAPTDPSAADPSSAGPSAPDLGFSAGSHPR